METFNEKIKPDLNPRQWEAVTHEGGPLLILAGAGSGKTRVLTYKAAYLIRESGVRPYHIMAVTFTNKAASEMKTRLETLVGPMVADMQVSTFHSFCLRILRRWGERLGFEKNFSVYDQDDSLSLIKRCMDDLDISTKSHAPRAVAEYISRAKEVMVGPQEYDKSAKAYFNKIVSQVYELYQVRLKQANALDFDDLLYYSSLLLKNNPDLLEILQKRYRHILVDEYQDTNHVQFLLVRMLAESHRNLTVVGDDDQSIYGWRGADITNILNFEKSFPDCKIIKLEQNYRSTKVILKTASEVVKHNRSRKGKTLWTDGDEGEKVSLVKTYSDREEAEMIADKIEAVVASGSYQRNQIAILYRTNAQSRALEESFKNRLIPYTIVGGIRFYQRKEIKDILAYLNLLVNPFDLVSFRRIINYPRRGIGPKAVATIEQKGVSASLSPFEAVVNSDNFSYLKGTAKKGAARFQNFYREMIMAKQEKSLEELVRLVIEKCGVIEDLEETDPTQAEARKENIDELLAAISEFALNREEVSLEAFLEEISLYTDIDSWDESQDVITLMTLHSAKGLEFPMVFITGLEEGLFPLSRAIEEPSELEEERRLFYVGITRARKRLILSYAQKRMRFGEILSIRSRFVDELPEDCIEFEDLTYSDGYNSRQVYSSSGSNGDVDELPGDSYAHLKTGRMIIHPTWGEGKILSRQGYADSTTVEVRFKWGGKKKLFAKYANLKTKK